MPQLPQIAFLKPTKTTNPASCKNRPPPPPLTQVDCGSSESHPEAVEAVAKSEPINKQEPTPPVDASLAPAQDETDISPSPTIDEVEKATEVDASTSEEPVPSPYHENNVTREKVADVQLSDPDSKVASEQILSAEGSSPAPPKNNQGAEESKKAPDNTKEAAVKTPGFMSSVHTDPAAAVDKVDVHASPNDAVTSDKSEKLAPNDTILVAISDHANEIPPTNQAANNIESSSDSPAPTEHSVSLPLPTPTEPTDITAQHPGTLNPADNPQ